MSIFSGTRRPILLRVGGSLSYLLLRSEQVSLVPAAGRINLKWEALALGDWVVF